MLINGINILVLEAIYQRDASKYKSKYKPNIGWFMSLSEIWVQHSYLDMMADDLSIRREVIRGLQCVRLVLVQREHQRWWRQRSAVEAGVSLLVFCCTAHFLFSSINAVSEVFSDAVVLFIFTGITQWLVHNKRSGNYAVGALIFHNLSFLYKLQWKRLVWLTYQTISVFCVFFLHTVGSRSLRAFFLISTKCFITCDNLLLLVT